MSLKTIAGGFNGAFWWYGPLSEDQLQTFKQFKGETGGKPNTCQILQNVALVLIYFILYGFWNYFKYAKTKSYVTRLLQNVLNHFPI